jgi:hypothetical protein
MQQASELPEPHGVTSQTAAEFRILNVYVTKVLAAEPEDASQSVAGSNLLLFSVYLTMLSTSKIIDP